MRARERKTQRQTDRQRLVGDYPERWQVSMLASATLKGSVTQPNLPTCSKPEEACMTKRGPIFSSLSFFPLLHTFTGVQWLNWIYKSFPHESAKLNSISNNFDRFLG